MKKTTAKRIKRFMKENHLAVASVNPIGGGLILVRFTDDGLGLLPPLWMEQKLRKLASLPKYEVRWLDTYDPVCHGYYNHKDHEMNRITNHMVYGLAGYTCKKKLYRLTQDELYRICKNAKIDVIPDIYSEITSIISGIKSIHENSHYGLMGDIIDVDDNILHPYPSTPDIPNMENFKEMLQKG